MHFLFNAHMKPRQAAVENVQVRRPAVSAHPASPFPSRPGLADHLQTTPIPAEQQSSILQSAPGCPRIMWM